MNFYVYEHWRPDKDVCFWVGKGCGRRAYRFKRNRYYNNVVARLVKLGMCVEVRMVAGELDEAAAFLLERRRIEFWRASGVRLANLTSGGEGVSNPSGQTRFLIGTARRGKIVSLETRRRLSEAHRKRLSDPAERAKSINRPETIAKNPLLQKGRVISEATRAALSVSHVGKKDSGTTRAKKAAALIGRPVSVETRLKLAAQRGWKHSEEAKAKMRGPRGSVDHEVVK